MSNIKERIEKAKSKMKTAALATMISATPIVSYANDGGQGKDDVRENKIEQVETNSDAFKMHYGVCNYDFGVVNEVLRENGAEAVDFKIKPSVGKMVTPLENLLASFASDDKKYASDMAALLIANDVDYNLEKRKETLKFAEKNGKLVVREVLGDAETNALVSAVENCDFEVVNRLLKIPHVDVNRSSHDYDRNNDYMSSHQYAMYHPSSLEALIMKMRLYKDEIPNEQLKMLDLLVSKGADTKEGVAFAKELEAPHVVKAINNSVAKNLAKTNVKSR